MMDEKTGDRTHTRAPALELDSAHYQQFLDDADITDAQKRELIETLWTIVIQFVDLGFGIEATQRAIGPLIDMPPNPEPLNSGPEGKRLLEANFEKASGAQSEKETSEKEKQYEIQ